MLVQGSVNLWAANKDYPIKYTIKVETEIDIKNHYYALLDEHQIKMCNAVKDLVKLTKDTFGNLKKKEMLKEIDRRYPKIKMYSVHGVDEFEEMADFVDIYHDFLNPRIGQPFLMFHAGFVNMEEDSLLALIGHEDWTEDWIRGLPFTYRFVSELFKKEEI